MIDKQQNKKENNSEVNLQFLNNVRKNILIDPKTQAVVIVERSEDSSVYTTTDEENVLLSFSS